MNYIKVKRVLDVVLSFLGLIILMPLLLLICLFIKLDSKGPVVFKQTRLGLNGNVFQIYKFRSMYVGAEKEGVYEQKGDARVTRIGRIIRKTSMDEFPQFFNIIKGDMSIIGPRPALTYHPWPFDEYTDLQKKRFHVRPGLTGLAQINGRKGLEWDQRIQYDVEYVETLTFHGDFNIFLKTILVVLTMRNNVNTEITVRNKKEKN